MNHKERSVIVAILAIVAFMVAMDLFTDTKEGVAVWHVLVEGGAGVAALFGIFYFMKGSYNLQHKLSDSMSENAKLKKEAEDWKTEAQKYIEGLSKSIDLQLTKWNLSQAEKEVALLLLKGLSLKEIAIIRNTAEKTARVQSISIYSKSGLAGRSELAAFFLEDLLQPQKY
ncbi:helix-turn-helix transcriptional regulator [uncultured Bdellovibrio sp.]|uniref:helix-turn-helix transcriptional regulator n=1 Tax=Bdellovibrio sp. HCB-162 TaxID=3394234 RepID=UPI00260003DC|nr:LuxR C-terminal-related transcriptional regulator [uncultured Bdellovibrio sp.]